MALVLSVFSSSLPSSPGCCALSRPPGRESSSFPLASPLPPWGSQAEVTDCGRAALVVTAGGGPGRREFEVV